MIKFTLITVCYNAVKALECTLESVCMQTHPAIEHLIIDGASTDDTATTVEAYRQRYAELPKTRTLVFCSEPDNGIYDAMNKGLVKATGDYLLFLNAGDRLHASDTLERIAAQLQEDDLPKEQLAVLYGDTDLVDDTGRFLRHRRLSPPSHLRSRDFRNGMLVCHQAFLVRTDLAQCFPYQLRYRLSADYDWCIRIMREAERQGLELHNTQLIVADYLAEGMTTRHHKASLWERFHIMAEHYGLLTALTRHVWFVIRTIWKH